VTDTGFLFAWKKGRSSHFEGVHVGETWLRRGVVMVYHAAESPVNNLFLMRSKEEANILPA
jgi:hypothetical protein